MYSLVPELLPNRYPTGGSLLAYLTVLSAVMEHRTDHCRSWYFGDLITGAWPNCAAILTFFVRNVQLHASNDSNDYTIHIINNSLT